MQKITIAIDGFSSTGKSTIAKRLASTLGYIYVDTGAMYRAVTLFAINEGFIVENEDIPGLLRHLNQIQLKFVPNKELDRSEMYLNGENVEAEIRTMKVSEQVSKIAAIAEVRELLVDMQQKMGKEKGLVMDGRDIGTVVFPDAELKIFMTADMDVRAKRRFQELHAKNPNITY